MGRILALLFTSERPRYKELQTKVSHNIQKEKNATESFYILSPHVLARQQDQTFLLYFPRFKHPDALQHRISQVFPSITSR